MWSSPFSVIDGLVSGGEESCEAGEGRGGRRQYRKEEEVEGRTIGWEGGVVYMVDRVALSDSGDGELVVSSSSGGSEDASMAYT